jgi:hypothetical protein
MASTSRRMIRRACSARQLFTKRCTVRRGFGAKRSGVWSRDGEVTRKYDRGRKTRSYEILNRINRLASRPCRCLNAGGRTSCSGAGWPLRPR